MLSIHPQFLTDKGGKKISAVLPMQEFQRIVEDLEELEDIRQYDFAQKDKRNPISQSKAMEMIAKERAKLGK